MAWIDRDARERYSAGRLQREALGGQSAHLVGARREIEQHGRVLAVLEK
jgi:hypothetical protein